MKDNETTPEKASTLRRRAEETRRGQTSDVDGLSASEIHCLIHELEVHQIELEMQNEELRRAQHDLEAVRDKYYELYDLAPVAYFTLSESGVILEANLTATTLLGLGRHSLLGVRIFRFIASEDQDTFYRHQRKVLTTESRQSCEIKMVKWDGALFYACLESVRVKDRNVTGPQYLTVVIDITERRRMEEKWKRERDHAQKYLDIAGVIFVVIGADQRVSLINQKGCQVLGYEEKDIIGKNWFDNFVPIPVRTRVKQGFGQLMRGEIEAMEYFENPILAKGGDERFIAWHNALLYDESGRITSTLSSGEDITERKKAEQTRNRFFSVASHELRTPLTNMSLSLELIARSAPGALPPSIKAMIDMACRSSERLKRLVNDILDIQKLEAGDLGAPRKPMELMPVVEEAIIAGRAYAEQFGVHYVLESKLPGAKVKADNDRLIQVLTNLLANAARFSPSGAKVEVGVCRHDGAIRVAITDHGPGIPEGFREDVFQPFAQAEPSLEDARHKDSAGLGLSIAKAIVEGFGGQIGFDSEPNVATTFYFDVPEWSGEEQRGG